MTPASANHQFRIDEKLHKQVELEHSEGLLIVRTTYRVGNSVTTDETQIAVVGTPRSEPGTHGMQIFYRVRPFAIAPWLTIERSRFF